MDTIQVRTEIQKVLEQVPEDILPEVLDYLKQIQRLSPETVKLNNDINRIFSEDKGLFERLAK